MALCGRRQGGAGTRLAVRFLPPGQKVLLCSLTPPAGMWGLANICPQLSLDSAYRCWKTISFAFKQGLNVKEGGLFVVGGREKGLGLAGAF